MMNLRPEAVAFLSTLRRARAWHIRTDKTGKSLSLAMALQRDGLVRITHHYHRGAKWRPYAVFEMTPVGTRETIDQELAAINAEHPEG